ncbi:MAG TPA: HAMP domain-containing sensor histidine kinase, partial [Spirochaetia bacterium]
RLLNEGAVHSAELLECILQWARAQTGRLEVHPSPLRLAELCDGIVELEGAAAAAKEIRLESRVSPEAIAFADHEMVATIVRNLVSNALKFTPRGGEVVVGSRRDHDALLLTVTDNGVGMSAVDAAKLFRIDVSFSSPGTESEKGHGMGLILCRELVQLNRGTIEVTSAPAHGSTFTVRLPAATLDD